MPASGPTTLGTPPPSPAASPTAPPVAPAAHAAPSDAPVATSPIPAGPPPARPLGARQPPPPTSPPPTGTGPGTAPGTGIEDLPGGAASDDGDTTRPFSLPNSSILVDEIVELVAAEAEALLSGGEDADERLADLNVRLSLIAWDVLEDEEDAARYLELAERHPLTPRLALSHAIAGLDTPGTDATELERAQALADGVTDPRERLVLLRDAAEAWLYRKGDAHRAATAAAHGVDLGGDAELLAELRYLSATARAVGGEWEGVVAGAVEAARSAQATADDLADAAALLLDRKADPAAAIDLAMTALTRGERAVERARGTPALAHWLRLIDVALDAALASGDARVVDLAARKLAVLDGEPGAATEAAAWRYLAALERRARGVADDGALARLAEATGDVAGFGPRLAAATLVWHATVDRRWRDAGARRRDLVRTAPAAAPAWLTAAHAWRAFELLDAHGEPVAALDAARDAMARARTTSGQRALERLTLIADPAAAVVQLEAQAADGQRAALRRAAAIIESRLGDLPRAAAVLAPMIDERPAGPPRLAEAEHLARLYRRAKERDKLADLYRATATQIRDKRAAAAILCAAGAIDLSRNRPLEAEESFVAASRQAPRDTASRAALVAIYRKTARWREVGQVLAELTQLVAHEDTRVRLLREYGALLHEQLGDARKARQVLEQALAASPDDPGAHHELAKLYDLARQWDKSVELRQRAVELTKDPRKQAVLLMEIGQIEEKRNDEAAALSAYDRASRADGQLLDALRAQASLHRKARRSDRLLDVLRAELGRGVDVPRRLQIQLEVARLVQDGKADSVEALAAFLDVLQLEPDNAPALAGVERIARASGRWAELAQAYRRAPSTPANLRILADALEHLGEWGELATVRQAELDAVSSPSEKARLATSLAQLYEHKLGDLDGAARMLQISAASGPINDQAHRELVRVLEQSQRWPELAVALERELSALPSSAVDRQTALLVKLAELRRDKLGKPGDAALAYEGVLERQPGHAGALAALEALYDRLGREKDLLRILELRAEGTGDPRERAQLFSRIAEVKHTRGDVDGAITAFMAAFTADPSDRATFTAMEKLCYSHERWTSAMHLYDTAIGMVENGQIRAYRLGDLYARRGQVQLQYLGEQEAAASSYMRVVELDPENDTSVKFLESIYSQKNDWTALVKAYELRAGLTRDDERRLDSLRRAARIAGAKIKDSIEAARIYQAILDVDPSDQEALDALERFYERASDWGKLVDVLRLRLNTAPAGDAATSLLRRIAQICEEGLRDEAKAIEHYLRILEIAPGNKEALEALGRIYESTEQWAEFIDVTRRQIRVTTDRNLKALLYFKCGSVMEAKFGKEEDAIRYYDAAIKTSPSCLPAVHGLRDLYRRREDWPRVIQTLELEVKLWQDDKERAGVFAQIGRIYEQRLGQPDRAMHYYESALAVDPECLPANQSLFEHWFDAGEWQRALPLAQALAQKAMRDGDPNTRSEFYRKRGVVFQMTGDPRGAAESLIIALEIKPDNVSSLDTLGELAKRHPDAYDFDATYRELDKLYKKRDEAAALVARVRVAQAVMKEREGDLDAAEALYQEAVGLAPTDFTIMQALVDLHCNMRRWTHAVDAIVRFLERAGTARHADGASVLTDEVRLTAMMRQAEIHADCEMDPHRAISVLREVLRLAPTHQEAYYRMAQEQYLLGRHTEARAAVERVIELAAAPGNTITPESLARFYYYRGRIIEVSGDVRGATSQYRRAIEYDPGYAPPALALARRAAETGDQRTAETLLIDAAHAAMASSGPQAAVPLQRGLARILLASGDRPAAIEAYRGILNVEPDNATDRVALAEIYAIDDPQRAVAELRKVIDRDIHHAPAYRLLSSFYTRLGEFDRAARVLSVMEQLGFAEDADRGAAAKARSMLAHQPLRRSLDDELRQRLLLTAAARDALGEVFTAMAQEVSALFPQPGFGENLVPVQTLEDPALKVSIADIARMYSVEADLYIGDKVPGNVVVTAFPRKMIVVDRALMAEPDPSRRYLLGWAHEAIRGGYALLLHLGRRQRAELGSLLKALLLPEAERAGPTNDFVRALPKRAVKVLERHVGRGRDLDTEAWIDGMIACAKRGGLLACDDFAAASWMIARVSGENLGHLGSQEATVALGAVLGGADLVRFFLSDDYHRARDALSTVAAPTP